MWATGLEKECHAAALYKKISFRLRDGEPNGGAPQSGSGLQYQARRTVYWQQFDCEEARHRHFTDRVLGLDWASCRTKLQTRRNDSPMGIPVIVIGAGGHAKVLIDALLAIGTEVLGATDMDPVRLDSSICGLRVLGDDNILI